MELSASALEHLSLAGDATHIPDKSFGKLVLCACQGVLLEEHRDVVADNPAFKDLDKAVLKSGYSGLVTLLLEAAKHDSTEQTISTILEECKYTPERVKELNKIFTIQKPHLQLLIGKIGSSFPHIVDIDWRLDYYMKNNHMEKVNSAVYLISLKTEVAGETELKEVQFSCSLEQLQDLVGKLKDATKCLEKISQV
ncbi:comm domain-containing protein 3 [Plakobranchus ocellatus]|uniref:COMM domain-containing protein 3 n=1 Tax=Plakobranchus ocellatus TaxID=259542 RepID=A0AAV4CXL7_9GAST|nr:comm domain-containing protein 3 [Plakobranchus ocellatus]